MKLRPLNDTTVLKSTDNATEIQLAVTDNVDEVLDLSLFQSVNVAIGINGTQYSSESVVVAEDNQSFIFTISNDLPASTYNVEVTLLTTEGKAHIAPSEGNFPLKIEKSMNELGETVTVMSVQQLLNDIANVKAQSEAATVLVNQNTANVDAITVVANGAETKADDALDIANTAYNKAELAIEDSGVAKSNANIAINIANDAIDTANESHVLATQAIADSSTAEEVADNALATANIAKTTADAVRNEFDQIVSGNVDSEVINARTNASSQTFVTVKERLDDADSKRINEIANAIQTANAYTDNAIANVDLSIVDGHVNDTDVHVTSSDKNNWNNKVDSVSGKGLSTNDFTTADKDKLASLENTDTSTLATKEEFTNHANNTSHITSAERTKWDKVVVDEATHKLDNTHVHWIGTASGTNALTVSYEAITALTTGLGVAFLNATASTGATTLNVNGLGAKPIVKSNGSAVNNLKANGIYTLRYANGNFTLQGEGGEYGTATASDVLVGKTIGTDDGLINGALTLASLGGKKWASGFFEVGESNKLLFSTIGFTPRTVIILSSNGFYGFESKDLTVLTTSTPYSYNNANGGSAYLASVIKNDSVEFFVSYGTSYRRQWIVTE